MPPDNGTPPTESVPALLQQARALYDREQPAEAAALFERVLAREPGNAAALSGLGLARVALDQPEVGAELIERALKIELDHPEYLNHLGQAYRPMGKNREAADCFRRALERRPESAELNDHLGGALEALGRTGEAAEHYQRATELAPDRWQAWYNLGTLHWFQGNTERAIELYEKVLALKADHLGTLNNLGVAYKRAGHPQRAADCYQRALAVSPSAFAYTNLGNIYKSQQQPTEAERCFRKALELDADFYQAHYNLAFLLRPHHLAETITHLRQAVEIQPRAAQMHLALANALRDHGDVAAAIGHYQRALVFEPDGFEAHHNLAAALHRLNRLDEAVIHYRLAIALNPDADLAHNNLGAIFRTLNMPDEAAEQFRRALAINPDCFQAHLNFAELLHKDGDSQAAIAHLHKTLALQPNYSEAWNNLAGLHKELGDWDEAVRCYRRALELQPDFAWAHSNLLLGMQYQDAITERELFEESRRYQKAHAAAMIEPHDNDPDPERRLRIGYVSPDFRAHVVSWFLGPLFRAHDKRTVELFGYADVIKPDGVTDRLRSCCDHWRASDTLSDEDLARRIRADRIDVLIELTGHTARNRLPMLALKPAPVQISWLGYPGTTGLDAIDYRLTDAVADPEGDADRWHSETLIRLPGGFHCFHPPPGLPDVAVGPLPAAATGQVTFGSFNNLNKVNETTIRLWAGVLRRVPDALLLIKARALADPSQRDRLLQRFQHDGVAAERLKPMGHLPDLAQNLALYNAVDIALDTFPYCGTTTTCDALWMGVPLVTLSGHRHAARVGASLLTHVGLPELVAADAAEFADIAAALATDRDRLAILRAGLRQRFQTSPLYDAKGFAAKIEQTYRTLWRRWCANTDQT